MLAAPAVPTTAIPLALPVPFPLQFLPSGFALPPLPYLLGLVVAVASVVALLRRIDPAVTPAVVAGFAPWMVAGAAGYALFQVGGVPSPAAPLFGSPAVYLSTFVLAGLVWAALDTGGFPADSWSPRSVPSLLLVSGAGTAGAVVVVAFATADRLRPLLPGLGLVVALVVALGVWLALRRVRPITRAAGSAGFVLVAGHVVDGVSTAVGTDLLGFGEQTPLSRLLIEVGAALAPGLGGGWLFALVKTALAAAVLVVLADYVEEEPRWGLLLVGVVAAVGLGPGAHNLVLFVIAG
ncbi:MAG: DUF63 family protein [Haloarculaceae archaeon]